MVVIWIDVVKYNIIYNSCNSTGYFILALNSIILLHELKILAKLFTYYVQVTHMLYNAPHNAVITVWEILKFRGSFVMEP